MPDEADLRFMRTALALADRQLGRVAPNPAVACIIVRDAREIAHGVTGAGGRPHAEESALALLAAGAAAGATAFVTLEPCWVRSNGAKSCSELLAEARIARVVIAIANPHHQTGGGGLARLRGAGVTIEVGLCEVEARALNAGFFCLLETGHPLIVFGGDPSRCDAPFATRAGETPELALSRLGAARLTRVWAAPDDRGALALAAGGARSVKG